jgi:hypothetical protein
MSFGSPVRNGLGIGLTPSTALSSLRVGGRPAMFLNFVGATALSDMVTFSRGSNATLVDSTGKITYAPANLLLYSQDIGNGAAWSQSGSSITFNSVTAPDGTVTGETITRTATNTGECIARQAVAQAVSTAYAFSCYVKAGSANGMLYFRNLAVDGSITTGVAQFNPQNGDISLTYGSTYTGKATMTAVGSGWYRCVIVGITASSIANNLVDIGVTNGTSALGGAAGDFIYVWGAQLEPVTYQTTPSTYVATTTAAYYGPRFDYDPVTLAAKGLLIEEQRTNLLTYSEQFDNAAWVKDAATVTANATTAPDGTSAADKVIATATTAFHAVRQSVTGTVASYTYSVYAKASEYSKLIMANSGAGTWSATFDLTTGATISTGGLAVLSSSIQSAGNGWYRCSVTFTGVALLTAHSIIGYPNTGATLNNFGASYTGDGTSGIFLWGAQLEAGAFATSYIPTVASQVTRSADVATMTGTNFSSWYNQTEGTFVSDFDKYSTASRGGVLCAGNISGVSGTGITIDGQNNGKVRAFIENAGALVMDNLTLADYTANTPIKGAIAYATNNSVGAAAGALGTVDTSVAVPTVDNFQIGAVRNTTAAAVLPLNGHIRQIAYYNTRLPNATLQALTA